MLLTSEALHLGYAGKSLIGPLNLELPTGRLTCLLGANGAGKSTLIRTLVGMQKPVAGQIMLDGQSLDSLSTAELARRLAVVLTDKVEVELLTGFELAALGRYPHINWSGRLTEQDRRIVDEALLNAGAAQLAQHKVGRMSDGERQRVMLARALAQQPKVLVLDEITAFLDLPQRIETMHLLQRLARHQQLAVLVSCHDLELALRFADLVWLIDEQRQWHAGAPEDLVLNGSLASAFARPGLRFDMELGEWHSIRPTGKPIALKSEGLTRVWTRRALQRIGYDIQAQADLTIHAGPGSFRLAGISGEQHFFSLASLLDALERTA